MLKIVTALFAADTQTSKFHQTFKCMQQ